MYYLSCILINVLNILWHIQCPRFKLMYFFLFYLIFAFRFLNHDVLLSSLLLFNVHSHKSWQISSLQLFPSHHYTLTFWRLFYHHIYTPRSFQQIVSLFTGTATFT